MMDDPAFKCKIKRDKDCGNSSNGDENLRESNSYSQLNEHPLPKAVNKPTGTIELKRTIGFFSSVGILVGSIIGSGIFISPKGVLLGSGSVALTLIIWVICGIFSVLGGLAFVELATLIPTSGGEYIYLLECFAPTRRKEKLFWGPLIPFLFSWTQNIVLRPAALAVRGLACAEYIVRLTSVGCEGIAANQDKDLQVRLFACLTIIIITFINCYSVKLSTRMVNLFTLAKVAALAFIIVCGIIELARGTNRALNTGFEDTVLGFNGIATAFYSGLYAYAGWNNLNNITGEMVNPKRDFLRSVVTSVVIVIVLYLFVNVSYFIVLSKEDFLASTAVSVDVANTVAGRVGATFMVVSVVASIFGSTTAGLFAYIRSLCVSAKEGHFVEFFSYFDMNNLTPTSALIFNCLLTIGMISSTDILGLVSIIGFLGGIFTIATMIALLIMRRTKKHMERSFTVPTVVPYIVIAFKLFLLVMPFMKNPKVDFLYAVAFLFFGFFVYVPFVYYELVFPGLSFCVVVRWSFILQVSKFCDYELVIILI